MHEQTELFFLAGSFFREFRDYLTRENAWSTFDKSPFICLLQAMIMQQEEKIPKKMKIKNIMNNCYTCNACNVYDGWCVKCDPKCDKLKFMRKNRGKLPLGTRKISLIGSAGASMKRRENENVRWPFKFDDIISIFSR